MCPTKVKNITVFSVHFKQEHIHSCQTCGKEFENPNDLQKHIASEHENKCIFCEDTFESLSSLTEHTKENHSKEVYKCEMCAFEETTLDSIQSHILEVHYKPDENGRFTCDECNYKCDSRQSLKEHFHHEHMEDKEKRETDTTKNNTETENLKQELKLLKNNFKRLEGMFHDSLEEMNKVKSEYEGKLIEANDKYRAIKAENEELKEKVDILFKLGRSYINRNEDKQNKEKPSPLTENDDVETVDIEEENSNDEKDDGDNIDDLRTWTQSKLRGFKRVGPSEPATKNTTPKKRTPPVPLPPLPARSSLTSTTATASPPLDTSSSRTDLKEKEKSNSPGTKRALYCHYFSNYGKCYYEEKTGRTCKFQHTNAPMCQNGMACQRSKCMYKHPNMEATQAQNFLDQNHTMPRSVTPWQIQMPMINPWLTSNQLMNPWNMEWRRR